MIQIRHHDIRRPIPRGWKLAQSLQAMHHNRHSVLITPIARQWKQKTDRRIGVTAGRLLVAMPLGWHTARALANMLRKKRDNVGVQLLRAYRKGLVERREVVCSHCGQRVLEWRRK